MTAVKNMTATPATDRSARLKRRILFLLCVLIPLGVGFFSGILTRDKMTLFQSLNKPPLTPPGYIFPIVWAILYLMMGISSYIAIVNSDDLHQAILITIPFVFQLALNFFWSFLFFNLQSYDGAFACLILLLLMLLRTMMLFYTTAPISSYLLTPYFFWVVFAGYLNFGIIALN